MKAVSKSLSFSFNNSLDSRYAEKTTIESAATDAYDLTCQAPMAICCIRAYRAIILIASNEPFLMVLTCFIFLSEKMPASNAVKMHPAANVLIGDNATINGGIAPIIISSVNRVGSFCLTWNIAKSIAHAK